MTYGQNWLDRSFGKLAAKTRQVPVDEKTAPPPVIVNMNHDIADAYIAVQQTREVPCLAMS